MKLRVVADFYFAHRPILAYFTDHVILSANIAILLKTLTNVPDGIKVSVSTFLVATLPFWFVNRCGMNICPA